MHQHAHQMLCNRVFYIQVRQVTFKSANGGQRAIRILGYLGKEYFFPIIGGGNQSWAAESGGSSGLVPAQQNCEGETSGSNVAAAIVTAVELVCP